MKKMTKDKMPAFIASLAREQDVYVPVKSGGQVDFQLWQDKTEMALEGLKTAKSPKEFFFPKSEVLYRCTKSEEGLLLEAETLPHKDFIICGLRGCDYKGIEILDSVFLEEPEDCCYQARREHSTLITLACNTPSETCFCHAFGIDPGAPFGDLTMMVGDTDVYFWARTEKGSLLLEKAAAFLEEDDGEAVKKQQERIRAWMQELPYATLSLAAEKRAGLKELFASPVWEQLHQACLGCGTCTFLCPTCQCYDIRDFDTGWGIEKQRCWDSCMYSDFTLMAHGNPRTSQKERFRQRFLHKLVYHPDNHNGEYSCTGCGRCVEKCPASLNIVKVIKSLEEWSDV